MPRLNRENCFAIPLGSALTVSTGAVPDNWQELLFPAEGDRAQLQRHIGTDSDGRPTFSGRDALINLLRIIYGHWSRLGAGDQAAWQQSLLIGIDACSPGYYNRIADLERGINKPKNIIDCLFKYRISLVTKVARSISSEVHAYNRVFRIAAEQGYGVSVPNMQDPYTVSMNRSKVLQDLSVEFSKSYTFIIILKDIQQRIMDEVVEGGMDSYDGQVIGENYITTLSRYLKEEGEELELGDYISERDDGGYYLNWPAINKKLFQRLLNINYFVFENQGEVIRRFNDFIDRDLSEISLDVIQQMLGLCSAEMSEFQDLCKFAYKNRIEVWNRLGVLLDELDDAVITRGNHILFTAAVYGHVTAVRRILAAQGVNVNQVNAVGFTALMIAAQNGHAAVVKRILAAEGVNVNQVNAQGVTALMIAAQKGHTAVVKRILAAQGVNVNQVNAQGYTALIMAADKGHSAIVERLLFAGADVSLVGPQRVTALMLAAQNGHAAVVKRILAVQGVNVNQVNAQRWTALMFAAQNGHAAVVKRILAAEGINVDQVNARGNTALMLAAQNGHAAVVKRILAAEGVDVNQVNAQGVTALMLAAKNGHTTAVERILAAEGVNVNRVDAQRWTALMLAAKNGHTTVVERILAVQGVNVNQVNAQGVTALMLAAENGLTAVVGIIIADRRVCIQSLFSCLEIVTLKSYTVLVEIVSKEIANRILADGTNVNSILHRAIRGGHTTLVESILRIEGIDVCARDYDGYTALGVAAEEGNAEILEMVLARVDVNTGHINNDVNEALYNAVMAEQANHVAIILRRPDVNVNYVNEEESATPLIAAVDNGDSDTVQAILAVGDKVDVNYENSYGNTALYFAARAGHASVVEMLLRRADLNVNRQDEEGLTALSHAASRGYAAIVNMILQRPDVNVIHAIYRGGKGISRRNAILQRLLEEVVQRSLPENAVDFGISDVVRQVVDPDSDREVQTFLQNVLERVLTSPNDNFNCSDLRVYTALMIAVYYVPNRVNEILQRAGVNFQPASVEDFIELMRTDLGTQANLLRLIGTATNAGYVIQVLKEMLKSIECLPEASYEDQSAAYESRIIASRQRNIDTLILNSVHANTILSALIELRGLRAAKAKVFNENIAELIQQGENAINYARQIIERELPTVIVQTPQVINGGRRISREAPGTGAAANFITGVGVVVGPIRRDRNPPSSGVSNEERGSKRFRPGY